MVIAVAVVAVVALARAPVHRLAALEVRVVMGICVYGLCVVPELT